MRLSFALQRSAGNSATQRWLGLHPKLRVGGAHDPEEREADRAASTVRTQFESDRSLAPAVQPPRASTCRCEGGDVPCGCGRAAATHGVAPLSTQHRAPGVGSGQPLSLDARRMMEATFGTDLSTVRVHTDARAGMAATSLGARAYTAGADVVFGPGEYSPHTGPGLELIAHEIAHVKKNTTGPSGGALPGGDAGSASPVVRIHRMAASAGRPSGTGTHGVTLSSPHDPLERQADAMASRALSLSPSVCHCGSPDCECAHGGQKPTIWRRAESWRGAASPPSPSLLGGALTEGRALDDATRSAMERRFGHDFSHVRIHTGPRADAAARAVEAVAMTIRSHVAFREGAYAPSTSKGDRLLAHELAHVVQEDHGLGHGVLHRDHHDTDVALDDASLEREGDIVDPLERSEGVQVPEPPAAADRETAPERPAEGAAYVWFQGVLLSDDREFMRAEIRRLIGRIGLDGAAEWHSALIGTRVTVPLPFSAHARAYGGLRPRTPLDVVNDTRRAQEVAGLQPVATEVYREIRGEAVQFLRQFEDRARQTTLEILRESEIRVEAERMRYGLQRIERTQMRYERGELGPALPVPHVTVEHRMATSVSSQGLAGAARDLRDKRNEINRVSLRQSRLMRHIVSHVVVRSYVPPENQAEYDRLGTELVELRRQYDVLRATYQDRYPILASYGDDPEAISRIAGGPSPEAAAVLNEQIHDKLDKIQQVRDGLAPGGRVKVWKLPEIVTLTKMAAGARPGTVLGRMRSRIVDDEARRIVERDRLTDIALAVLAIGLALLAAIPSGGSSVVAGVAAVASIASLGLSVYQVAEHIQQYQIESAMAGTDFDKARAISSSEPSLFWLGVDILGAALDVGPALRGTRQLLTIGQRNFQRLAPAVQQALHASGPDTGRKLEELRRLAGESEHGGAGLASRVVARVEQLRGTARSVEGTLGRAAGHEARAVERAGAALAREAASPLAQAPARLGGHTIKVTPNGWLVRCTVCGQLRDTYASELVRDHGLARRLLELEDMSARAARTGDRALAQRAADGAQLLETQLEMVRRTREVRLYRGLRPGALDDMFLMDRRLIVDMEFVGRGVRGATSAGWERNAARYWEEIIRRHPEAFSDANLRRIRGTPPLARPYAPVNDEQFRRVFTQYDVRGLRGKALVHHHVGGGGQAAAIPAPLHPGSGGVHNVERAAGIWRGEDPIAEMLERLLAQTTP